LIGAFDRTSKIPSTFKGKTPSSSISPWADHASTISSSVNLVLIILKHRNDLANPPKLVHGSAAWPVSKSFRNIASVSERMRQTFTGNAGNRHTRTVVNEMLPIGMSMLAHRTPMIKSPLMMLPERSQDRPSPNYTALTSMLIAHSPWPDHGSFVIPTNLQAMKGLLPATELSPETVFDTIQDKVQRIMIVPQPDLPMRQLPLQGCIGLNPMPDKKLLQRSNRSGGAGPAGRSPEISINPQRTSLAHPSLDDPSRHDQHWFMRPLSVVKQRCSGIAILENSSHGPQDHLSQRAQDSIIEMTDFATIHDLAISNSSDHLGSEFLGSWNHRHSLGGPDQLLHNFSLLASSPSGGNMHDT
jgi:hypothetical protein